MSSRTKRVICQQCKSSFTNKIILSTHKCERRERAAAPKKNVKPHHKKRGVLISQNPESDDDSIPVKKKKPTKKNNPVPRTSVLKKISQHSLAKNSKVKVLLHAEEHYSLSGTEKNMVKPIWEPKESEIVFVKSHEIDQPLSSFNYNDVDPLLESEPIAFEAMKESKGEKVEADETGEATETGGTVETVQAGKAGENLKEVGEAEETGGTVLKVEAVENLNEVVEVTTVFEDVKEVEKASEYLTDATIAPINTCIQQDNKKSKKKSEKYVTKEYLTTAINSLQKSLGEVKVSTSAMGTSFENCRSEMELQRQEALYSSSYRRTKLLPIANDNRLQMVSDILENKKEGRNEILATINNNIPSSNTDYQKLKVLFKDEYLREANLTGAANKKSLNGIGQQFLTDIEVAWRTVHQDEWISILRKFIRRAKKRNYNTAHYGTNKAKIAEKRKTTRQQKAASKKA